jgi:hypothetical protein
MNNQTDLTVIKNVLPDSLIFKIKKWCKECTNHSSNYALWDNNIVLDSSPVLVYPLEEPLKNEVLSILQKLNIDVGLDCGVNYYKWTKGSYIPWHEDMGYKSGTTIYLNESWDKNWGGYFAYEISGKIKCIKPEFNMAVKIKPPIQHTVFLTSSVAPIRETLQIFYKN